jgi:hypothetical protein
MDGKIKYLLGENEAEAVVIVAILKKTKSRQLNCGNYAFK